MKTGKPKLQKRRHARYLPAKFAFLAAVWLIRIFPVFPLAAAASEIDAGEEKKPDCSLEQSVGISRESTDNLFRIGFNRTGDVDRRLSYSGRIYCVPDEENSYTFKLDYENNNYEKNAVEDYSNTDVALNYKRYLSATGWAELGGEHTRTHASENSLNTIAARETEFHATLGQQAGKNTTAELYASRAREKNEFYTSADSDTAGYGIRFTYDLGGFSSVEAGWEKGRSKYPNEFIYGLAKDDEGFDTVVVTDINRSDGASVFTAAITKTFSLYPINYLQIAAEKTRNSSNSAGYYEWYDPVTFDYFFKLVGGYDDYSDFNWTVYYIRGLGKRATAILLYMRDTTDYPNLFISSPYTAEPDTPLSTTLTYSQIALQYELNPGLTLEISRARLKSGANDPLYSYSQKLFNLGMNLDF